MRILVADDDRDLRRLLELLLQKWEYEVVLASDGVEALEILKAPDGPRLAILDWQMPRMNGTDVCQHLRKLETLPYVYTILLTAKDTKQDVIEGINAGADDYLTKPFNSLELHARIRSGRRILDLESALRRSLNEVRRAEEALAEARRREIEVGVKIQQTLLMGQHPPSTEAVSIASLSAPSQEIDGDFSDFVTHSDSCFDVVLGDVMGKGVPAALMGAALKTHFVRASSQWAPPDSPTALPTPEQIVTAVHKAVTAEFISLERFITLCYARFDLITGRVTLVDCGHTGVIHRDGHSRRVNVYHGDNMPLGFSETEVYHERVITFEPGDLFLFYSDGVTEAQDPAGDMYGQERLIDLVDECGEMEPELFLEKLRADVLRFSGHLALRDDLTAIAVRVIRASCLQLAQVKVNSSLRELPHIRAFVRAFCRAISSAAGGEFSEELELAASEAAANIIKHAHAGKSNEKIMLRAEAYADRITLRFDYEGASFDPTSVEPPRFDGSRDGGFGLFLISEAVDEARYSTGPNGNNSIYLIKKFEP